MFNRPKTFGVIILLVASSLLFAIPQASAHGPASTALCGTSITSSTTLTENVGPCPSNGIMISADNVVLNCNGHSVIGTGPGTGIQTAPGVSGATIENCTATNFVYGLLLGTGGNDVLVNDVGYQNTVWGFFVVSHDSVIQNDMAMKNAQGGFVFLGSGDTSGYGYGNQVTNNKAIDNGQNIGDNGFGFVATVGDTLTNNKAVGNTGNGFRFSNGQSLATGNTLSGNKAINNGAWGFTDLTSGSGTSGTANTYIKNVCEANGFGGSSPSGLC